MDSQKLSQMPPEWANQPQCILFEGGTVGCALSWVIWCIGFFIAVFNTYYVRQVDRKNTKAIKAVSSTESSIVEEKQ
jgi:hypothetical protein